MLDELDEIRKRRDERRPVLGALNNADEDFNWLVYEVQRSREDLRGVRKENRWLLEQLDAVRAENRLLFPALERKKDTDA